MRKRQIILGGGTFEPIRNHLSLAAPAFGSTAVRLHQLIPGSELMLTRMADRNSLLLSNSDVEELIDRLLLHPDLDVIILNIAFCDFRAEPLDDIPNGFHSERLRTAEGSCQVKLNPTEKIITKIKHQRPDVFLVGFKTTTGKISEEQVSIASKMLKESKCDLVLANDTVERNNIIINQHQQICFETHNRELALSELATLIRIRDLSS